ncbi:MAG TPA: polysaccharide deacetylase family protein [Saprospiraceae bacterium]|nr:polysaccharide deacetylase family protein [Saprospiraceae bacterium]
MFSDLTWHIQGEEKALYLSFDDGPIPEVTPWVMEQLDAFQAKATFFCVGDNIQKHPQIFEQLKAKGHTIGNHTYNHLSGWANDNLDYILNVRKGAVISGSRLFRPPYGRLRPSQTRFLKHHYRIIMWDVLSGDFDPNLSAEACYQNVIRNSKGGSIIVFHDSIKSKDKLYEVLPRILKYYSLEGYQFKAIDPFQIMSMAHPRAYAVDDLQPTI